MHDVVIVGAGPVGLFLACELGLAGCAVLVLEREPEPGSPWRADPLGMRGLSLASVEAFYRRGMLHSLLKASGVDDYPSADEPPSWRGPLRRNGARPGQGRRCRVGVPASQPGNGRRDDNPRSSRDSAVRAGSQAGRGDQARRHGFSHRTGRRERGRARREHEYSARWLVGCDGGRSAVRGLAGFDFVGTEPQFTGYVGLVTIADPEAEPWDQPDADGHVRPDDRGGAHRRDGLRLRCLRPFAAADP
ncbi:FAD-dependent oxidoreductase [Kibdelosporangium aridum]|uniref:FAD-dependent oxidoreductase n=1 Tax=Kibdelosporangium aridum TaxID=2030 RepID=UPI0035E5160F